MSESNQLTLKNLAQGTTEESLMKVLREISLNPSKVFFVNFDKEIYAQISFPDYQSCKSVFAAQGASLRRVFDFISAESRESFSHFFVLIFLFSVQCGCDY